MKFKIGDRVEENGLFDRTGTIYGIDSMCKTYLIKWDYPQRSTWMVEEDLERIEQTEDVPDIGVGKNYNPKGRTESSMTILGDVLKEAYCSGYADGLSDRIESDYDRGLHDAWECARKMYRLRADGNNVPFERVFGEYTIFGEILCNLSASEAIEKIKKYESEEVGLNYNKGHDDDMIDAAVNTNEAYDKGVTEGYNKGAAEAWEAARKIAVFDASEGGLSFGELDDLFGTPTVSATMREVSALDAITKIKEYEVEEQAKNWYDIPAEEMTEDQLRQAVKDLLRKRIGELT